ncbi:transmembrane protein [Achlya hypogyna]|uniref:Transmembrane protein n=1 Tax=Achlya hypogyna TaxID=1202772 RepID=A0A1V9ZM19_ACHHY|nr:transmembrane protein [Achlya hypogyna]
MRLALFLAALALACAQPDINELPSIYPSCAAMDPAEAALLQACARDAPPSSLASLASLIRDYIPIETIEEGAALIFSMPELSTHVDAGEVGIAVQDVLVASWGALVAWLALLKLLLVPVLAYLLILADLLMPHAKSAAVALFDAFLDLEPEVQGAIVASMLLLWIALRKGYFKKAFRLYLRVRAWLRRLYHGALDQVYAKSKLAGMALPHAVFAFAAYAVVGAGPDVMLFVLGHENLLLVLSRYVPVFKSLQTVYIRRRKALTEPLTPTDDEYLEHCLHVWILWALYHTAVGLVTLALPAFLVSSCSVSLLTTNLFLLWFYLPLTRGYRVVYAMVAAWMHPYANRIPVPEDEHASSNMVLRALTAMGALSPRSANVLRDLRAQGPALLGLLFLGTPGFLTMRGCDAVALAFPAYVAMGTLALGHRRTHEWWVCYFTVVAVVEAFYSSVEVVLWWLPFFYHTKLLLLLWLQFPYFRGAQVVFDAVFRSVFILRPRRPRLTTTSPTEAGAVDPYDRPT